MGTTDRYLHVATGIAVVAFVFSLLPLGRGLGGSEVVFGLFALLAINLGVVAGAIAIATSDLAEQRTRIVVGLAGAAVAIGVLAPLVF